MKNRRLLFTLLLLIVGGGVLQAQSLFVNDNNGNQTGYALKNIQRMQFVSGNLEILPSNGDSMEEYALQDIRNLTFSSETIGINDDLSLSNQLIHLYPNPVAHTLHIDLSNVKTGGSIQIFNMTGQLLQTQKVGEDQCTLNVEHLPKGVYFCHYNHLKQTEIVKFIKN